MFNFIGEPYTTSPTFPWNDDRPFPVPLFIEAIKAGEDVIPQRDYAYPEATPMSESEYVPPTDPSFFPRPNPPPSFPARGRNTIPESTTPYFLKADTGPTYFLNSQSCAPLTLARNTSGTFALSVLAGIGPRERFPGFTAARSEREQGPFHVGRQLKLASHSLFRVIEGKFRFTVDGETEVVTGGESIMVPAGKAFSYVITSAYARMYVFSGKGGGLEEVFVRAGRVGKKGEVVGGNEDEAVAESKVDEAVKALGAEIV